MIRPGIGGSGNARQGLTGSQRKTGGANGASGSRPTPPSGMGGAQRPSGAPRPSGNNGRPHMGGNYRPQSGVRSPGNGSGGAPMRRGTPPGNGRGMPPSRNGQRLPPPPPRPNRNRYSPPPSPKRPRSYRKNNGCVNMLIGGVVIALILLIVLLIVLRNNCTGCAGDPSSSVGNSNSTSTSSTGNTGGSSMPTSNNSQSTSQESSGSTESSSSTSVTPPPLPADPLITLERNIPENAFNPECVIDELGWFNDVKSAGESLKFVYDKLGIQPYVVFRKYDADLKSDEDKVQFCVDWYKANITDEDTFLLMYFAEKESNNDIGYTVYYSGTNAAVSAEKFRGILEEGFNEYWFTELSTDKVIEYAFQYTCNRIAIKKSDDSTSDAPSNSTDDESGNDSSTEETGDTGNTTE